MLTEFNMNDLPLIDQKVRVGERGHGDQWRKLNPGSTNQASNTEQYEIDFENFETMQVRD